MKDLRKAAEQAIEAIMHGGVKEQAAAVYELRQALAQEEKPPVKSYCGGKPNYCTPDPHVDAVNMSQERVDETAKREHEPYGYLWFTHQMERRFTHYRPKEEQRIGEVTPIYTAPPKREWVGIDEKEVAWLWFWMGNREKINGYEFAKAIEAKLKERNGG
jgi:hypothetical protein